MAGLGSGGFSAPLILPEGLFYKQAFVSDGENRGLGRGGWPSAVFLDKAWDPCPSCWGLQRAQREAKSISSENPPEKDGDTGPAPRPHQEEPCGQLRPLGAGGCEQGEPTPWPRPRRTGRCCLQGRWSWVLPAQPPAGEALSRRTQVWEGLGRAWTGWDPGGVVT